MRITIDGKAQTVDLSKYPAKYRTQEVFLCLAEENPGRDVVLLEESEIIGWRNDNEIHSHRGGENETLQNQLQKQNSN